MKPINSRERSKQLWQFVFIFFALAVIPVALIFFSYYRVPEAISESEQSKLAEYYGFKNMQTSIVRRMSDLDTSLDAYADAPDENKRLEDKIKDGIADFAKADSTNSLLLFIKKAYDNHYYRVVNLRGIRSKADKCAKDLEKAIKDAENARAHANSGFFGATTPDNLPK